MSKRGELLDQMASAFDYTHSTVVYPKDGAVEYCMLGLISEIGELAALLKRKIRDLVNPSLDMLEAELGDIYWYWNRLCWENGLDPWDVIGENRRKLLDRLKRNQIHGSGDKR